MSEQSDWKEGQKVEALERAFLILEAFSDGTARLTLAELTRRTGLYRSTALRLAASLERAGFVRRDPDGLFRLGPSLWRLGVLYERAFDLAAEVRPALERLTEATGETSAFYIREGERRVCLYRRHSTRVIRHHLEEGAHLPLDVGASARVLMAFTDGSGGFYEQIRLAGFYLSLGERDPETASVAAPVFGGEGRLAGAIAVVGLRAHFDEARVKELVGEVRAAATQLSARLGAPSKS